MNAVDSTPGRELLFVVNEAGEFTELRRVALEAKAQGHGIHFLFAQPGYINLKRDRAFCRMNGFRDYYPGKKLKLTANAVQASRRAEDLQGGYIPYSLLHPRKHRPYAVRLLALALSLVMRFPLSAADRMDKVFDRVREKGQLRKSKPYTYARMVFFHVRPQLVIFGQEFPGSVNSLLVKICNQHQVPTLIVPFAVGTTKEMVESLVDKREYEVEHSLANRLAAYLFPHWVNYYGGKSLLRLPGRTIMALEALGMAPEHPWLPNNSRVTRIAVESPEMERYYRSMRFPDSQLCLTGAACDDVLTAARNTLEVSRQKVFRRSKIDPAKRLLVCAWPTNQYGSRFIPLEFDSYEKLCHAWARTLALVVRLTDFNVVIRPHPVTDPDFLANVLRHHRLHHKITDIDTLELVPVCDLFVACVSSTLRWAIACGIPAINYDCYDYGYTDFDVAEGVFTVKNHGSFETTLLRLTEDQEAYEDAKRGQETCAAQWGLHDGGSMQRIQALIHNLLAQPRNASYAAGEPASSFK